MATLPFFIPIAVKTPISYLRSRTLKMLSTIRIIAPIIKITSKNQPAIVERVLRGLKLFSNWFKSLEETVSEIKEYSVKYADAIESGRLKKIIESVAKTEDTFETMTSEDTELLANILEFFGQRTFLTCVMPDDLRASLLKRIEESK